MTRDLLAAAAMADAPAAAGGPPHGPIDGDVDPAAVVSILRANKVRLLELHEAEWNRAVTGSCAWSEARAGESARRAELLREYEQVVTILGAEGIRPILFKSPGGLPYLSSNFDALVRPARMCDAAAALARAGHLRFPHYREPHKLLFRRFSEGRSVICMHLHSAVSWGRVMILPGDDVADRSPAGQQGPCRVAAPEDLFLTTLAHALYETDQIRLADLRIVRHCVSGAGFDWDVVLGRAASQGWSEGLGSIITIVASAEKALYGGSSMPAAILDGARRAVTSSRWVGTYPLRMSRHLAGAPPATLPLPLSRVHSKRQFLIKLAGQPSRSPDERIADVLATVRELAANRIKARCRPAVLISVSGLDGAGKSQVCTALREAMSLCEIPVRVVWTRGGFGSGLSALKRVARDSMRGRLPGPADARGKIRWLSGRLAGGVFSLLVAAEQSLALAVGVRARLLLGFSVICDRYAYDTAADLETKVGRGRASVRFAAWLMTTLAPRPDLPILLRLDASRAACRKPGDAPAADLAARFLSFERLARENGLTILDASRPAAQVSGEAVERALRKAFGVFENGRGDRP